MSRIEVQYVFRTGLNCINKTGCYSTVGVDEKIYSRFLSQSDFILVENEKNSFPKIDEGSVSIGYSFNYLDLVVYAFYEGVI